MGNIILIAAISQNGIIGINNQLPWPKISEDFKRFKSLTIGNSVVMGRRTFESIYEMTKRPLVNRENIVLTKSNNTFPDGVKVMKSIDDVLEYSENVENMFIIGGEQIYKQFLPYANKMEITRIHRDYQGDCFFPEYNEKDWTLKNKDDRDFYSFLSYERKLDSFF
ncbi:MAG: dihydrofolate reductase [Candidatus Nanoarchaeia archaeon]|nr:dihydrofolate reductase [Candidatus Nanoarchaeia archaeon]